MSKRKQRSLNIFDEDMRMKVRNPSTGINIPQFCILEIALDIQDFSEDFQNDSNNPKCLQ